MRIKNIENEFLETKVDRLDSYTGLDYKNIFKAYIGLEDSDNLDLTLYKLNNKLKNKKDAIFITNSLAMTNNFDLIEKTKTEYSIVEKSNFTNSRIKLVNNTSLNSLILTNLDKLFTLIDSEIRHNKSNFAIKMMTWIKEYLKNVELDSTDIPKCIYYGDIKKHGCYFLLLLHLCKFDILYINPNNHGDIKHLSKYINDLDISENNNFSNEFISFEDRVLNGEKIDRSSINKATTITADVQQRVYSEMYNDTGMVLNSWQLQDYTLKPLVLHTTFEEISIYYNQALSFRPHYSSSDNIIDAPVFFTKITGVHNNDNDYSNFIHAIKSNDKTLFLEFNGDESILNTKSFTKNDFKLSYLIDSKNHISRDSIINNNDYNLSILDTKLQNKILDTLEEVFDSNLFLEQLSVSDKVRILHFLLNINKKLLLLIENFAYGSVNPKLVLYINERTNMSTEFCAILLLLHKLGLDILLLTPVGSKDIEKVLSEEVINFHRLSKIVDRLDLSQINSNSSSERGFIGKLFDKFKR